MAVSHRLFFRLLTLTAVLLNASCEKTYGIEVSFGQETTISISAGQPDSVFREQKILFREMQARHQIHDLQQYKGVWTLFFNHGRKARFSESVFPLLQADEAGQWIISGTNTGIDVRSDEDGNLLLPSLTLGEDGYWALDSLHTDFSTDAYHTFILEEGNDSLNINGFLADNDCLYIYLSDQSIRKYSILKEGFYLVPEYWMNQLVEKEKLAETAIREADGDCASFIFFTDSHWGKNMKKSPSLIRHMMDFTPFDDVIFGGDVITTHSTNLVAPMELGRDFQASFAFLGTRFHCLYGNHDNNSDSQRKKTEYHLSEEQVYSWLQSQMTDVVYGGYYNFYYDNPATKTRIIGLDTGRYYYSEFWDTLPGTVRFAVDALGSLPDGWHAIMASHIWCLNKKGPDGQYQPYVGGFILPILKVFDDYNARLSGVYRYQEESVPYDFSNSGGTIEFCIGGHTHIEFLSNSEGGISIIVSNSDYAKTPQPGTDQEQSVTMVVADYKNRKLNLFVVGRGTDHLIDL